MFYICSKMKAILKVILLLALVQVGCRIMSGATSEDNFGGCDEFSLQYHQDNNIEKPTCNFISSFGECAPILVVGFIQRRGTPSGKPTSSASSFGASMNALKGMAVSINPHREKQYDMDAPFYCMLPSGYYIFALHRIIV